MKGDRFHVTELNVDTEGNFVLRNTEYEQSNQSEWVDYTGVYNDH